MDYYQVLQVSKKASDEEIKKSYQQLILKHHPDKAKSGNEEKFLLINKAYKILRDPIQRRIYDSELFEKESSHVIIHEYVRRKDFEFDEENENFSYRCKCGNMYILDKDDFVDDGDDDEFIMNCDECSLNICVKS
jgi:diphthamide biosynthesis protein 4